MSSILKGTNVSYKTDSAYYIDPNKIITVADDENAKVSSLKDTLTARLNELEKQIEIANREYERIMQNCDKRVKETEGLVEQISHDAYEEAFNKGYNDGKQNLENEFQNMQNELNNKYTTMVQNFENEKHEFVNQMRDDISEMVFLAVNNILTDDVMTNKDKKDLVNSIILRGLCSITDEKEVKIYLSEDDYKIFDKEELLKKIGSTSYELSFSMKKDLKPNDCIIETNLGYIDVSLNNLINTVCAFVRGKIN